MKPSPGTDPASPAGGLTTVELTWLEKRVEHRIRFGRPVTSKIIDRRRRVVSFAPDMVFGFVRWAANDYGTVVSRIDIVRTVAAGEPCQTLPFVRPGGEILLKIESWPKVERVLQLIDGIEALGLDPSQAAPDYWRHVHNRLIAGEAPRAYSMEQHRAYLLRRKATP